MAHLAHEVGALAGRLDGALALCGGGEDLLVLGRDVDGLAEQVRAPEGGRYPHTELLGTPGVARHPVRALEGEVGGAVPLLEEAADAQAVLVGHEAVERLDVVGQALRVHAEDAREARGDVGGVKVVGAQEEQGIVARLGPRLVKEPLAFASVLLLAE